MEPVGMAVIGAGYWGPNLMRNVQVSPMANLLMVCDRDRERAESAAAKVGGARVVLDAEEVFADPAVEAVVVATPAGTHHAVAAAAMNAGKHVLVEKPLATSVEEGEELVRLARDRGLVLMCDHTYCYTPAVQMLRDIVRSGELGDVQFVDSVRINLGLVQQDINVIWDLAPHDLSILEFLLGDQLGDEVSALGTDPIHAGQACIGYLTLPIGEVGIAHIHVNWLSPTKLRTFVIGGSAKTVVWDDLNPQRRINVFDHGVDLSHELDQEERRRILVSYRTGSIVSPAVPEGEALAAVIAEFASSIREHRQPLTDGEAGLRVLRLLEAADRSLASGGRFSR